MSPQELLFIKLEEKAEFHRSEYFRLELELRRLHQNLRLEGKKQCTQCRYIKPLSDFYPDPRWRKDGTLAACKKCNVLANKISRSKRIAMRKRVRPILPASYEIAEKSVIIKETPSPKPVKQKIVSKYQNLLEEELNPGKSYTDYLKEGK